MNVLSIIMFCAAILFIILGLAIYNGKTKLIIKHHQENVKEDDKTSYGKAFSVGLFILAFSFAISGVFALFEDYPFLLMIGMIVFIVGIISSIVVIIIVQNKS